MRQDTVLTFVSERRDAARASPTGGVKRHVYCTGLSQRSRPGGLRARLPGSGSRGVGPSAPAVREVG